MRLGFSALLAMASAFSPLVATLVLKESFSTPETTATLVGVSSTIKTSFLSGLDIIRLEVVYQTGNDKRIAFTTATRECERDTRASSTF